MRTLIMTTAVLLALSTASWAQQSQQVPPTGTQGDTVGVKGLPGNKSGPAMKPGQPSQSRQNSNHLGQSATGDSAAGANATGIQGMPGNKSGRAVRPGQSAQQMPEQEQNLGESSEREGIAQEMMGRMMAERGMHHHWTGHQARMAPVLMRMIFALMDTDGDGTVSLQEWQSAHEKIFKAMDADKDGTITFEEMINFFRGGGRSSPHR